MGFIKPIIDEWDPVNLLSHAPQDEYHSEIADIQQLLSHTSDPLILAEEIYNIFLNSFGSTAFQKTKYDCIKIAEQLLR